ncbi:scarecrow-like protein 6 [Iris pallida]|uniref:Scarecrow-like protein 6 n=1 Tax=Iris pallida TaxID=29817 RepID=A0AAX6EAX1_IRIPA|nr:scarecrow-like protein 6 [Iris pallida]
MIGMPFGIQVAGGGGLEEEANFWSKRRKGLDGAAAAAAAEPTSVLDKRSTSPPTSSSTLSSSHLGPAASSGDAGPTGCLDGGAGDWQDLPDPSAGGHDTGQDHAFLHWMMGEDDSAEAGNAGGASGFGLVEPTCFGLEPPAIFPPPPPLLPGFFQEQQISPTNLMLNQHQHLPSLQNPHFLLNLPPFDAHPTSHFLPFPHNPAFPASAANAVAPMKPKMPASSASASAAPANDELVSALFRAAELVQSGDQVSARGILARLNQQLPSPIGKPLLRSAFYFKEALLLLATNTPPTPPLATPLDVLLKLGTYKAFSDISPVLQFTNFTSIQAILEELDGCDRIHIVDFDVGVGGHWSSFIQELAHRRRATNTTPSLRITAFASHSSHHPLELHLTRENLAHFAADLNVRFEFNVLGLDSFDALPMAADEAVAVNFPVGSGVSYQSVPAVVRLIKQLSPRIVVSVDHGCDRSDLTFSQHFLHAFQSCTVLLDSIDASGANPDIANKIERYLVQPRIESALLGHSQAVEKMLPLRTLFASARFVPVQFSNFTETQAECLLKRVQVRGFQVEKRQASLCLCWQREELASVSAWRC